MKTTYKVTRVGIHQVAKFGAAIYFLFGIFAGAALLAGLAKDRDITLYTFFFSIQPGRAIALGVPVLAAGFGYVNGAIVASLYNILTRFCGGIDVEMTAQEPSSTPTWTAPTRNDVGVRD